MSKTTSTFNPPRPVRHGDKWRIRWFDETGKRRSEVFADWSDAYLFGIERGLEAERRRLHSEPLGRATLRCRRTAHPRLW